MTTLYNEGMLEGLKMARVFLRKELWRNPTSGRLVRILRDLQEAIRQEEFNIYKQGGK